ncbi:MAG: TRAFs-binding domain-containing protein [Opitutaceae bacterium]
MNRVCTIEALCVACMVPAMSSDPTAGSSASSSHVLAQDVQEYERLVRESASSGQLLTAIEVARDGLARLGGGKTLQQQLALALAQTGALDAARNVLAQALEGSVRDEETLCLLGRVQKEMWRRAPDRREAEEAIRLACEYYREAFAIAQGYYPGINLAFTLAAAGDRSGARDCAGQVARICRTGLGEPEPARGLLGRMFGRSEPAPAPVVSVDGWLVATLAEALVHLGEPEEAARRYQHAAELFHGRWRDLASMRRQAREILGFSGEPARWLDACFRFPSVAVFSGHMIDAPGRLTPRFPPALEPVAREAIRDHLANIDAGWGYSSAACGGDLLFCECLLERDAKVNLVLPCAVDAFRRQSVRHGGEEWEKRFDAVLARATSTLILNSAGGGGSGEGAGPVGLVYANRILTGLAALQARALDLELCPVALWDGVPAGLNGGTASVVAEWRERGFQPHLISLPATVSASDVPPSAPASSRVAPLAITLPHEIKVLVLAEVVNFRKVAEFQLPAFVEHVRRAVGGVVSASGVVPESADVSGGSFQFVVGSLAAAARLALDLRDALARRPWAELGLPADLALRVAVHAGPVFAFTDPVTGRLACLGTHVVRAQHILPTVAAGQVFVSQEFAALCGAERLPGIDLEFLGRLPTTRMFEEAPLYRLERGP